jgi:hypothetical protein
MAVATASIGKWSGLTPRLILEAALHPALGGNEFATFPMRHDSTDYDGDQNGGSEDVKDEVKPHTLTLPAQ